MSVYCLGGDAAYAGCGLYGDSAEIDHFDEFSQMRVEFSEFFQSLVDAENLFKTFFRGQKHLIEVNPLARRRALAGACASNVINKPPPQETGRDTKEVRAILPIDGSGTKKFQEYLVD